jgi:hypothetical protein
MTKPSWLRDAIAKENGYYSKKGELLKVAALTKAECDEWNGVVVEQKKEPVVKKTAAKKSLKKKSNAKASDDLGITLRED